MIKEKNNMDNSLLDKDEHNNTNNTNKIKNNIFFILCIFYTFCISTICSLFTIIFFPFFISAKSFDKHSKLFS